ncbi:unnamed protein product [Ectocarpus sp. CCAP 1310/34]|nr:unnamed protein product [Ectocarpus sp. CCAP 1310/34]
MRARLWSVFVPGIISLHHWKAVATSYDPAAAAAAERKPQDVHSDRGLIRIDPLELRRQHAAMAWKEEDERILFGGRTRYSVIVVEAEHHTSNLAREKERVRAFEDSTNTAVVSVQFTSPYPHAPITEGSAAPFFVSHPEGDEAAPVDKKVRVVHLKDIGTHVKPYQASHLQASCDDPTETTVLIISDETCRTSDLPVGIPPSCRFNVVRAFPFNQDRANGEPRRPYLPLGPRDTFPFVSDDRRPLASRRSLFFNLQVRPETQGRRKELVEIASIYQLRNPGVQCATNRPSISTKAWQELVLDSKFTLCPAGRNPETFRLWEALEAGSIPIVSKLDFTHPVVGTKSNSTCGDGDIAWNTVAASPFAKQVSVNNWLELPDLLDRLQREPDEYINNLQEECEAWYSMAMTQAYTSLLNFGEGHDLFPQKGPIFDSLQAG